MAEDDSILHLKHHSVVFLYSGGSRVWNCRNLEKIKKKKNHYGDFGWER